MRTLEFTKTSTVSQIIESIKKVSEEELELIIPGDSPVRLNPINLRIMEKVASDLGKKISISEGTETAPEEVSQEQTPEEKKQEETPPADFQEGVDVGEEEAENLPENSEEPKEELTPAPVMSTPAAKGSLVPFPVPALPKVNLDSLLSKLAFLKKMPSKKFILPGAVIGGLLILLLVLFLNLPSAKIILYVAQKPIDRQMQVNASSLVSNVDFASNTVPLKTVDDTEEGNLTVQATGKKTTGDKAKGTIEIRNYDANNQKFVDAGVKVKVSGGSKAGLEFTLDRAATVPTATSTIDPLGRYISDPGRIEVAVTASKIGSDSNIPSGTTLAVGSFNSSTVTAIATKDFSGGNSRDIVVVSADDQKNALSTLTAQLSDKGATAVKSKIEADLKLPENGIKSLVLSKSFDKDIDSEAKDFTLSLKLKMVANVYSDSDLRKLIIKSMGAVIPDGYTLDDASSKIDSEVIKSNDQTLTLLARISGNLVPKIDKDSLKTKLKGRSYGKAAEILKSLNNVDGYEIKASPTLPAPFNWLPFKTAKITIELVSR